MTSRNGSRAWQAVFGIVFRLTPRRLMLALRDQNASSPLREVLLVGRRTGKQQNVVLSIFEIGGRWYVGHPNGQRAQWVRNMHAARSATVVGRDGRPIQVVCIPLPEGAERDSAIAATRRQPFPANLLYRAARRHVTAAGDYFRLQPLGSDTID